MNILADFVEQVTRTVLNQGLQKLGGKRRRRRLSPQEKIAREITAWLKP